MNMAVIGHIDSGKSTTLGHLIHKCGGIDHSTIERFEKEAKLIGKESFKYSWVLDNLKAERERGITIDIAMRKLETVNFLYTAIDTPGHRDFIKNMITGTSQADVAVLLVAAAPGEYEAGISKGGQTREHILLAHTLGVKQMIVCVNKMDATNPPYCEERFTDIQREVQDIAKTVGFVLANLQFVALCGFQGENLHERSSNMPWYKGATLLESLDKVTPPLRLDNKPLRIPIHDVYNISGVGTVVVGRVESGVIITQQDIAICPGKLTATVKSIEMHHQGLTQAIACDNVGLHITVPRTDVRRGQVISDPVNCSARECAVFNAQVVIMDHPGAIHAGYCPIIDCHTEHVAAKWEKLLCKIDRRSGKELETSPQCLKKGEAGKVTIRPKKPMCVETFAHFAPLGRFSVRDLKSTVAVGVILSVDVLQ